LVTDNFGNVRANVSVTFVALASEPSVIFNGSNGSATVNTNSQGIATSPSMTANSTSGSLTVTATTAAAAAPALFNLTNVTAGANRLAFVQQPTDAAAGPTITPAVTVQLEDSNGNKLAIAGIAITVQSNSMARLLRLLSGTTTQNTDTTGLATFAGLSISQAGTYQLLATAFRDLFGQEQRIQSPRARLR
jgi:adhesin/invasin